MKMELMVGCLSVLLISAFVVDWMLKDEAIVSQSSGLKKFASQTDKFSFNHQIGFVNQQFCLIFDAIYGKHAWSWKRLFRSTALSLFFVLFSVLLIGIENTYLAPITKSLVESHMFAKVILISLVFVSFNLAIDFISLLETRWVMGRAQNAGTITLVMWVAIDLVLTSVIYIFLFGFIITIIDSIIMGLSWERIISQEMWVNIYILFFSADKGLPFFISTFGTSIVWYMFVFFVFLIKSLSRSEKSRMLLDKIFESATPAYITVVIFSLPIVVVFGVYKSINWLLSN